MHLSGKNWSHIVYHLSLLGLEEIGKASILGALTIKHEMYRDGNYLTVAAP